MSQPFTAEEFKVFLDNLTGVKTGVENPDNNLFTIQIEGQIWNLDIRVEEYVKEFFHDMDFISSYNPNNVVMTDSSDKLLTTKEDWSLFVCILDSLAFKTGQCIRVNTFTEEAYACGCLTDDEIEVRAELSIDDGNIWCNLLKYCVINLNHFATKIANLKPMDVRLSLKVARSRTLDNLESNIAKQIVTRQEQGFNHYIRHHGVIVTEEYRDALEVICDQYRLEGYVVDQLDTAIRFTWS